MVDGRARTFGRPRPPRPHGDGRGGHLAFRLPPSAFRALPDLLAAVRTVPDFPRPGVAFKDLTPLLADPALFGVLLDRLAAPWGGAGVTHVVGVEARGFWCGPALAARLGAGFVPCRKPGKLPPPVVSARYALEYGEDALDLPAHAFRPGDRVLVHDDVLATGGTAAAACALVAEAGGAVAGVSVALEIAALAGRGRVGGVPVAAALTV